MNLKEPDSASTTFFETLEWERARKQHNDFRGWDQREIVFGYDDYSSDNANYGDGTITYQASIILLTCPRTINFIVKKAPFVPDVNIMYKTVFQSREKFKRMYWREMIEPYDFYINNLGQEIDRAYWLNE